MRGLWLENRKLEVRDDLLRPTAAPGEALVRVLLAGICNTDIELTRGYYPFTGIPGHEFVGVVEEEREFRVQLGRLQQEHRDLDAAILALAGSPGFDLIQVQRLKKRKLVLRDRISYIEDQLTPDIIA